MFFHQKIIVDYIIADSLNTKMFNLRSRHSLVLRSEIQLQAVNKLCTIFSIND
jgi:hypothetical protein